MVNARIPLLLILVLSFLSVSAGVALAQDRQQRLAEVLKRFPKTDANGDGVLSIEEARVFWQNRKANRSKAKGALVTKTHADITSRCGPEMV